MPELSSFATANVGGAQKSAPAGQFPVLSYGGPDVGERPWGNQRSVNTWLTPPPQLRNNPPTKRMAQLFGFPSQDGPWIGYAPNPQGAHGWSGVLSALMHACSGEVKPLASPGYHVKSPGA